MRNQIACVAVIAVLCGVCLGCGPDNPLGRKGVSGKVTFNGEPVKQGTITFGPLSNNVTLISGAIANGSYSFGDDVGVIPGEYGVTISIPDPNYSVDMGPEQAELQPNEFNNPAAHKVTVSEAGSNVFDFEVVNPNPPVYPKKKK